VELEVLPCQSCKSLSESAEGCAGATGGLCYAAGGAAVEVLIGPAWDVLGLGEREQKEKRSKTYNSISMAVVTGRCPFGIGRVAALFSHPSGKFRAYSGWV